MSDLTEPLLAWYDEHARELPWRGPSASPWSVLVSEFMLQQTPVARVRPGARGVAQPLADARPPWPPSPRARRSGPGAGSATPAAPCGCTPPRPRSSTGTAARCPRRTTTCWRCPGSGTTPRRPWRRSPSDAGTSCSTPTSAGSWPGCVAGEELPAPSVTRAERDRAAAAAARGRADRGHVVDRPDGARCPGLHGPVTARAASARSSGGCAWRAAGYPAYDGPAPGVPRRGPAPTASAAGG